MSIERRKEAVIIDCTISNGVSRGIGQSSDVRSKEFELGRDLRGYNREKIAKYWGPMVRQEGEE
jgi:hypothetical protein